MMRVLPAPSRVGPFVEVGDQLANSGVLLNELLPRADERVDIRIRDRQPGRDRLQALTLLGVRNAS